MNLERISLFSSGYVSDFNALSMLEDSQFVEVALGSYIGSGALGESKSELTYLLRAGYSKMYVLRNIQRLGGAEFKPGAIPGTRRRLARYVYGQLPIVGWFFRFVFKIPSESISERRQRVVENQLYLIAKKLAATGDIPLAPWGGEHRQEIVGYLRKLPVCHSKRTLLLAELLAGGGIQE